MVFLVEFDIVYFTQKAIKGQAVADHSTDNPVEAYEPVTYFFPNESMLITELDEDEHPNGQLYFDGAVNVYGNGIGVVLISPKGDNYLVAVQLKFPCTNTMPEYEACIVGL